MITLDDELSSGSPLIIIDLFPESCFNFLSNGKEIKVWLISTALENETQGKNILNNYLEINYNLIKIHLCKVICI